MIAKALPGRAVAEIRPLTGGLRNSNHHVRIDGMTESFVLRIYEHDRDLCPKEVDIHRLVRDVVPVADFIHAEPEGIAGGPPFAILRYVEGITFRELRRRGDPNATARAAASIGEVCARIGTFTFPHGGWLTKGPVPTSPLLEGDDACARFIDQCLTTAQLEPALHEAVHAYAWKMAPAYASVVDEACLVHCDFGSPNILVDEIDGAWRAAAILDWELAVAASPLIDVGHFLRHHRGARGAGSPDVEPHFSNAFLGAGGRLPDDWRELSRALDLTALCELLSRPRGLPPDLRSEIVELVRSTVQRSTVS